MPPGRTCTSRSVAPALIALGGLLLITCARTPLDEPVDLRGGAGRPGTTGSAGTTGRAGTGGAGTTGKAGTSGMAGTGAAGTGAAGTTGVAGTGGAQECEDGKTRCASLTTVQLCQGGKWAFPNPCSMQCLSGVCTECVPGGQECAGPASLRTCTSHGLWPEPVMCPGPAPICTKGVCSNVDGGAPMGDCMEGTSQCQDVGTLALCQGSKWSVFISCEHGCVDPGVCAECTPGEVRCNGAQKCTTMGIWEGAPCNN